MATVFATPRNNASTTVGSSGYTAGSYSLTLATGGGALFPALSGSNYYRITVCQVAFAYSPTATTSNYTIYKVTGVSGDVLTLSNTPLEGTSDRAYFAGDIVEIRVTSGTLSDIHTAVNALENAGGGVAGSNTQFQYNNSGTLAGSALLTQPNSNTVAIKGGAVGTVAATLTGATTASVSVGTQHHLLDVFRPSDSTVLASVIIARLSTGTGDYDASFMRATNFVATPGPSPDNQSPGIQVYNDSTPTHAGFVGAGVPGVAPGNDFVFAGYSSSVFVWSELFHCSATDNTTGAHINIPIYTAARKGIVVTGAASQTGDLQQWTDSTPTVLSGVGPAGHVRSVVGAGAPGGTPPNGSMYYDTTNNKFYVYNGAWKSVTLA